MVCCASIAFFVIISDSIICNRGYMNSKNTNTSTQYQIFFSLALVLAATRTYDYACGSRLDREAMQGCYQRSHTQRLLCL